MAKNDFQLLTPSGTITPITRQFLVAPGTTSSINVGEFVVKTPGSGSGKYAAAFTASASTQPAVGTDYLAGFAMSTSTETTTASGVVEVMIIQPGMTFLANPATASNYGQGTTPSQATYNAQVGKRVLIQTSSGVMTVLNTDAWTLAGGKNGLIVEYIDITQFPGKVAVSLNNNLLYASQLTVTSGAL